MELNPEYVESAGNTSPPDWPVTKLSRVLRFQVGFPFRSLFFNERAEGVRLARNRDLKTDDQICYYSGRYDDAYIIEDGDVLVGMDGDFRPCLWRKGRALLNQRVGRIVPLSDLNPVFAYYFLIDPLKDIEEVTSSTTVKHLSHRDVEEVEQPLPPLPEQRAIAAALSDVDALLDGLDRLIAKKRDLKEAAMQQLLTGKTRLPGFSGEWEVTRLGDVADIDPENLGPTTPADYRFNYIALEDVDRGCLRGYSEQAFGGAPSRARRKVRQADLLVSTVRPNLQSHLLFQQPTGEWVCSTGFCVVRCRPGVTDPRYIFSHFFSGPVVRRIDALLTGSNYPAISSGDVRELKILMPAYDEQTAIASVFSDMEAELAALEARRDKTRALKHAMMQELLTGRTRLV